MVGSAFQLLDYFRLEQLQEEFDFTTDEELDKNRRFKAILYREKEVPEFRNYKLIPCNEKELQDDIFQVSKHLMVTRTHNLDGILYR